MQTSLKFCHSAINMLKLINLELYILWPVFKCQSVLQIIFVVFFKRCNVSKNILFYQYLSCQSVFQIIFVLFFLKYVIYKKSQIQLQVLYYLYELTASALISSSWGTFLRPPYLNVLRRFCRQMDAAPL